MSLFYIFEKRKLVQSEVVNIVQGEVIIIVQGVINIVQSGVMNIVPSGVEVQLIGNINNHPSTPLRTIKRN
jgi:uncharacterized cupin superfamily protein